MRLGIHSYRSLQLFHDLATSFQDTGHFSGNEDGQGLVLGQAYLNVGSGLLHDVRARLCLLALVAKLLHLAVASLLDRNAENLLEMRRSANNIISENSSKS